MSQERSPDASDLPDSSPELILIIGLVHLILADVPKHKRRGRLREVTKLLAVFGDAMDIIRIQPRAEDKHIRKSIAAASTWWKQAQIVFERMETPK